MSSCINLLSNKYFFPEFVKIYVALVTTKEYLKFLPHNEAGVLRQQKSRPVFYYKTNYFSFGIATVKSCLKNQRVKR